MNAGLAGPLDVYLRAARWIVVLALPAILSGCTMTERMPIFPTPGYFYTHIHAPLVLPGVSDLGESLPSPEPGRQMYIRIPLPQVQPDFAFGRVDIEDAARRAGIDRLVYADYEYRSFLNYFKSITIHAYGYGLAEESGNGVVGEIANVSESHHRPE